MFDSCSQHLEIFFLPAVPTECLDRKWQPQIPMTLHSVLVSNLGFISKAEKHQRFKVYNILRLLHEAYNYSCIKNIFRYVDLNNHILVLLEKYNKQNVFFLERQNNNDE